jgi:hypothetical protein
MEAVEHAHQIASEIKAEVAKPETESKSAKATVVLSRHGWCRRAGASRRDRRDTPGKPRSANVLSSDLSVGVRVSEASQVSCTLGVL